MEDNPREDRAAADAADGRQILQLKFADMTVTVHLPPVAATLAQSVKVVWSQSLDIYPED